MLRCCQMLVASSLRSSYMSSHPSVLTPPSELDEWILKEFADYPGCRFGMHEIMRVGVGLDKFPGEWFGPTTGCRVVEGCLGKVEGEVYEGGRGIEVVVVEEGTVYVDQIEERMKKEEDEEEKVESEGASLWVLIYKRHEGGWEECELEDWR